MKPENMTPIKLNIRLKYRLRVAAAALHEAMRRTAGLVGRIWQAAGYYIALTALLTILGCAAYAYRQRPRQMAIQAAVSTPQPGTAVLSGQVLWPTPAPSPTPEPFRLVPPVPGAVLAPCSPDAVAWSETLRQWQTHPGTDFAAELGEAVCAAEAGEICGSYRDPLLGYTIEIQHDNGLLTRYAGLNTLSLVQVGQHVARGEVISAAGDSADAEAALGPHVHFELRSAGKALVPEFSEAE